MGEKTIGGNTYLLNEHYNKCGFRQHGKTKIYRNNTTSIEERKQLFEVLGSKAVNIFDMATCAVKITNTEPQEIKSVTEKPKRKRRTKKEIEAAKKIS